MAKRVKKKTDVKQGRSSALRAHQEGPASTVVKARIETLQQELKRNTAELAEMGIDVTSPVSIAAEVESATRLLQDISAEIASSLGWTRDLVAEAHLRNLGLDFEFRTISVNDVDRDKSLQNNARIGEPLTESVVMDYALMREAGDIFPAIVVGPAPVTTKSNSKSYVTVSGNHRYEMALLNSEETILAYAITTDNPAAIDTFARSINRKEGKRQDVQEAMVHALHELQKDDGTSVADVAERFGLKYGNVSLHKRAQDTRKALELGGVEGAYEIPHDAVVKLYSIRHSLDIMIAAAMLIVKFSLSGPIARDLISEIRSGSNDAERKATVKQWAERYKQAQGATSLPSKASPVRKKASRTVSTQGELFRNYFGALYNFLARGSKAGKTFTRLSQFKMTSEAEIAQYRAEWHETKKAIDKLFGE